MVTIPVACCVGDADESITRVVIVTTAAAPRSRCSVTKISPVVGLTAKKFLYMVLVRTSRPSFIFKDKHNRIIGFQVTTGREKEENLIDGSDGFNERIAQGCRPSVRIDGAQRVDDRVELDRFDGLRVLGDGREARQLVVTVVDVDEDDGAPGQRREAVVDGHDLEAVRRLFVVIQRFGYLQEAVVGADAESVVRRPLDFVSQPRVLTEVGVHGHHPRHIRSCVKSLPIQIDSKFVNQFHFYANCWMMVDFLNELPGPSSSEMVTL